MKYQVVICPKCKGKGKLYQLPEGRDTCLWCQGNEPFVIGPGYLTKQRILYVIKEKLLRDIITIEKHDSVTNQTYLGNAAVLLDILWTFNDKSFEVDIESKREYQDRIMKKALSGIR